MTDQEIIDKVLFLLGNPPSGVISQETIDMILQECKTNLGVDATDCDLTYCTLIDSLRYLIRNSQMKSGSLGSEVYRREKVGQREIQVQHSTEGTSSGWEDMLIDYQHHPEYVCPSLKAERTLNLVLIGGVSQKEYERVQSETDSRSAYFLNVGSKYNRRISRSVRRRSNRNK